MIKKNFNIRPLSSNNSCQLIVLMGFVLVISVVVLASFTSQLSNTGIKVQDVHSKAKIPEFVNIINQFKNSLEYKLNNNEDYNINSSFYNVTDFFYKSSISKGTYFNASLVDFRYNGHLFFMYQGFALYNIKANFTFNDGNINITKSSVMTITIDA